MAREFFDIPRCDPPYRDGRTADFEEVETRLTAEETHRQASRCMGCGIAFCHAAGCPLGNHIQEFNKTVKEDRLRDAYFLLAQTSPFSEFTARICPAPCEAACCAGISSDAVTIRQIEFAIIENAFRRGYVEPYKAPYNTGMRVAVVGSGPAGLATAERLNKLGHEVVVFEKNMNFGGLLRYGIPDFKLQKSVIERRLDVMRNSGIFFECGVSVGKDISAEYLRKKFDAVCLCLGAEVPRGFGADVVGGDMKGVHYALEFLGSQNRVVSGESKDLEICAKDKHVLVVGGGDTGSDCVGTSIRQGAKSVTQVEIMPKPPTERHTSTPWPLWPYMMRTSSSHKEGCERLWAVNVKEIVGRAGKAKSAVLNHCDWSFDALGRPKSFVERAGGKFKIDADLILLSMGFTGVCKEGSVQQLGVELTQRGVIATSDGFTTNVEGVFAAGDCVRGPSLVVHAIYSGRMLAERVDKYLKTVIKL